MKTVLLVWFLVGIGGPNGLEYSPPMDTLEDCKRLQAVVVERFNRGHACVQVHWVANPVWSNNVR